MKCERTCTENFQQVKFVVEVEAMEEISMWISSVRNAIKEGTTDVEGGKKKGTPLPPKKADQKPAKQLVKAPDDEMPVTQGQLNYLRKLGVPENEINELASFSEASQLIETLSGTKLRKQL